MASQHDLVLVTGGSGFLAAHCIVALLRKHYRVRTTLRSIKRADDVRASLKQGGIKDHQMKDVEFIVADLSDDSGWTDACKDCTYVLHVASPFPVSVPKDPNDLIIPARDGALRVLRAAKAARSVKRVVLTSSTAAIHDGHPARKEAFTEEDWTNLESTEVSPYPRSKTVAEKAAWDWIEKEGGSLELTVINPVGIYGPPLSKDYSPTLELIRRLLNGELPGLPNYGMAVVDVRDAADIHVKAMTNPAARGQRVIASSDDGFLWMADFAESLRRQLGERAKRVPTRTVPNFALRMVAWFDPAVRQIAPDLGKEKQTTNAKAKRVFEWQPRGADEALAAAAESLYRFGLVKS